MTYPFVLNSYRLDFGLLLVELEYLFEGFIKLEVQSFIQIGNDKISRSFSVSHGQTSCLIRIPKVLIPKKFIGIFVGGNRSTFGASGCFNEKFHVFRFF